MSEQVVNLSDPAVEPIDEELIGLSTRAFEGVRRSHEAALERLRGEIDAARAIVLQDLAARRARVPR